MVEKKGTQMYKRLKTIQPTFGNIILEFQITDLWETGCFLTSFLLIFYNKRKN